MMTVSHDMTKPAISGAYPGGGQEAWASTSYGPRCKAPANNKGADQPAHPHSLISAFIIRFLKSNVTRSDIS